MVLLGVALALGESRPVWLRFMRLARSVAAMLGCGLVRGRPAALPRHRAARRGAVAGARTRRARGRASRALVGGARRSTPRRLIPRAPPGVARRSSCSGSAPSRSSSSFLLLLRRCRSSCAGSAPPTPRSVSSWRPSRSARCSCGRRPAGPPIASAGGRSCWPARWSSSWPRSATAQRAARWASCWCACCTAAAWGSIPTAASAMVADRHAARRGGVRSSGSTARPAASRWRSGPITGITLVERLGFGARSSAIAGAVAAVALVLTARHSARR